KRNVLPNGRNNNANESDATCITTSDNLTSGDESLHDRKHRSHSNRGSYDLIPTSRQNCCRTSSPVKAKIKMMSPRCSHRPLSLLKPSELPKASKHKATSDYI